MENALASSVIGAVEAGQQDFEIGVTSNVDAEDLTGDATIKALDHTVGLGCIGLRCAMDGLSLRASAFKIIGGEV